MNKQHVKPVIREIVKNTLSEFLFVEDNRSVQIYSLPGDSGEFEWYANYHELRDWRIHTIFFERDRQLKQARIDNQKNFKAHWAAQRCIVAPIEDYAFSFNDSNLPKFAWLDYCGSPTEDKIGLNTEKLNKIEKNCVFIYTFETRWRLEEAVHPEILKDFKENENVSKADAIRNHFAKMVEGTKFKILFSIEYISQKTPMIVLAISNCEHLPQRNFDYLKGMKKKVKMSKATKASINEAIRADLKSGVSAESIKERYDVGDCCIRANKAWITMGL